MRKLLLFLCVVALTVACSAQADARPEIMVLGTYHMASPGRDLYNMKADDVLSHKRQQEHRGIDRLSE